MDLIDISEVLRITGLTRSTLHHHRAGHSKTPFPAPAIVAGQSPLWKRQDVEDWSGNERKRGPRVTGGGLLVDNKDIG